MMVYPFKIRKANIWLSIILMLAGSIVKAQPSITNFSPTSGAVGTLVTIKGANIQNPTQIIIGGVNAIPISSQGNTLVAMVMPGAVTGGISVTTSGGVINSTENFIVTPTQPPNAQLGAKLLGTGAVGNAQQGSSVSVSADGNTMIIGGRGDNNFAGAAWIFTRSGAGWVQEGTKLVGTGAVSINSQQGYSVAMSADGKTAMIGGYNDDGGKGAVWVFIRNGANWNQQGSKLVATDANADANMGSSIALSADGNTAIIGGYNDNGGIGAAWIFTRTGSVWSQSQKLIFSGESGNPNFGKSVAISADGTTAIIGGNADNSFKGASWIFVNSGGNFLQQGNKLVGTGASGGVAQQGWSVNLSADGNTAIVGGLYDVNKGAAWIFTRSGTNWVQQGSKLIGTGDIDGANQGSSVSLSADGNTAIIGGYQDNSGMGAIWVFTRNGIIWTQQGTKLVGTGATSNAKQGQSVAISANGNTVVVGGNGDDGSKGATWAFTYFPTPSISQFSPTVAATGTTIAITGTNLLGTTSINLGGASVSSFTIISSTSIIAVVGNGNSGNMSITTPGGTATLAGFSFIPPPTITGFSPSTAGAGANLIITGTNLNGTSLITLGGTLVSAFTIVSPTSIIAVVGNGSSGAISLTTPGGTASIEGFNFIPPPTITSINPNSVGAGGLITITGTNLSGTFEITLGGTTVQAFTVVSSTSIVAVVGGGTSGGISLTTPGGTASLGGFIFVQPPLISSFSSTFGPVGSLVTIYGSNLNNLLSVIIAGVGAIPISNDGNKLVAMVMPGATSGGVSVVTVGGTAVGTGNFSVTSSQPPNAQQGNKLVGTGAVNAARQGKSIAVSADGNTAIVGGYFDNGFRGAAWVYTRNGDTWVQQGNKLVVNDAIGNSNFGWSVAISADGNTAMVGGPADNFNIGAVWIFNRTENSWIQQAKLIGSGYIGRAQQGVGVAMSADGNTIIVGGDRDNSLIGAAWVFKRSGNIWTQQGAKLVGSNSIGQSQQGWNVSISGDGNTAILGGFGDNGGNGAAWVFTQNGNDWIQQGNKLFGNDGIGNSQQGWNVSLNADGNTAILGGYNDDGGVGAAWIFTRTGNIWSQQGNKLIGTGVQGVALQGADVALSADGNIALVGGHIDNNQVGAAWIFKRSGGSWTQVGNKLKAKDAIGASWMGYELALSADGNTAILGGLFDNGTNGASWAFTYIPPPTITSFSPIAAGKGDVLSIFGTNFSGTTAINLGGTAVDVFTVVSSTSIVAIVGTGATGAVSLVAPGGIASLDGFTFIPAPTITSFSPIAAAKGTVITIIGTNLTGSFLITLGGTSVQNFTVVDSTTIEAVVGDGSSGELRVTTLGGTAALSGFTFIPPPSISSFTPSTAATGEMISINGNHFNGTTIISLGGTLVSAFTIINSNSIVATVGNGSSGALSITTPGGSASLNGFIFIPPPAITSFIPTTAASGAILTINGNNLNGTSSLALGGTPVSAFTVVSASSILAQVGAGSTGAVSVTTPGGSASLNGFTFIPAPTIVSFTPGTTKAGGILTITGTNFEGTYSISLGGTLVRSFTIVSTTMIVAEVGNGSSGELRVTTLGGSASLNGFKFIPAPTITNFNPGKAKSGGLITITGNNFDSTFSITIGGTAVRSFTVVSSNSIIAEVGNGSSGAIQVTTPGGSASLEGFTFILPPILYDFYPKMAGSGKLISITGANFNDVIAISLGGTKVSSFKRISESNLLAVVSNGSSGSLSLVTAGGAVELSGFVFIPPPVITSFTPSSASTGSMLTITGEHFVGISKVTLGGIPVASFEVLSTTTMWVVVGSGASGSVYVSSLGGDTRKEGFTFLYYPPNFIPAISNAFSPNGDGINDYWRLDILKDYPKATVQVFTRLGQLVFSGIGYHQPWDGRYKGELLPVGTYYYTVDLQIGKPPLIGSISIIY
ncbi:MAG: hypothetical protein EBX50_00475 [Chitinophagia bacterium]|nr:hypothetical protein [Chitinophagia bacterium]